MALYSDSSESEVRLSDDTPNTPHFLVLTMGRGLKLAWAKR